MRKVSSGGPSTINGVRYQMLWSLLRTTELRILYCTKGEADGEIVPVLRLEPVGGGDDLQERGSEHSEVRAKPSVPAVEGSRKFPSVSPECDAHNFPI